jgi:hypothetical protein
MEGIRTSEDDWASTGFQDVKSKASAVMEVNFTQVLFEKCLNCE